MRGRGPMWMNRGMDTESKQVSVRTSVSQIATVVLAVALAFALLRVIEILDHGDVWLACLLAAVAIGEAGVSATWWRVRSHPRNLARAMAVLAGLCGLFVWLLANNMMGTPLFAVAICVLVVQFGLRAGALLGAVFLAMMLGLYLLSDSVPFGGVAANTVIVVALVAAGLASAHLVAQLDRAIALEAETSRLRREEALAEMDRVLASERAANARLLHDEIGQRLTVIGMGLDLATRLRTADPDSSSDAEAWTEVERSRAEAARALDELRTLVRSMSPLGTSETRQLDIDSALEKIAASFNGTGLNVRLERLPGRTDGALDELAYRIIQEGLTNAARHSGAENVTVSVAAGTTCRIRIHDDGGALPEAAEEGFGLINLRERVESAGGELVAEPGEHGFVLDASYPMQPVNA